ncbi:MarR family winged helix-turn-helix transcriptional regulator [Actinacidiphila acididurans]|uniref:MarR family transcriptional regulator n=1 Tax=Actinacidiphila acididurans TaxID=2784346 RepID=A0ABS2TUY9_9ACTN|nr:MarR family transcriptional regulator [Actinacidiphila acididurans]MBM9507152.1 MarR family transcriptional regulator [Actinacidiphila acididurans]
MPAANTVVGVSPEEQLPAGATTQEDTELRYLLLAAQREGARYMSGQLRALNLTPAQAEIILVLAQREPLTLAELGRLIVCESNSPSRIVDTLVKRGMVSRTPGQVDRRVVYLGLTEQGQELVPKLQEIDAAVDAAAAFRLSSDEKQVMIRGLRRMLDGTVSGAALATRFHG